MKICRAAVLTLSYIFVFEYYCRSAFMYGLVLISCRPLLAGAELFVDYRLNPENEMPKW